MKSYGLDYVAGSSARKIEEEDFEELKYKQAVKKKEKINSKPQMSTASKVKWTGTLLVGFAAVMTVTYRYNMISEANLKAIKLKSELENVSSQLSLAVMNVEQGANLNEVEAYAKQKLGMQKPDKNQIVYIDSSNVQNIKETSSSEVASSFFDKIKNFFGIN